MLNLFNSNGLYYVAAYNKSGNTIAKINKTTIIPEISCFVFLLCHENMRFTSLLTERILYMKFPVFASFIIFVIWLAFDLSRLKRKEEAARNAFWEKERLANSTRKKPLDDLAYITIPFEQLPTKLYAEEEPVKEYLETLHYISKSSIVNLTGITNTDLKLQYGAPNIEILTKYDQNYTTLVRTLQQWASFLYEKGNAKQAMEILEFAVSTGTDVSGTYKLLCQIYKEENTPEKIKSLYPVAESLNSLMKPSILRILQEADS